MADDDNDDFFAAFAEDNDLCEIEEKPSREDRLKQTEEDFAIQKAQWKPVCDEKQAARRILPDFVTSDPLELKIGAEERFYVRDYPAAIRLAKKALDMKAPMHDQEIEELKEIIEVSKRKLA